MSVNIIAVLCVFDIVFAIAVIIWNMSGKNKSVSNTEEVIKDAKHKQDLEQAVESKDEKEDAENAVEVVEKINETDDATQDEIVEPTIVEAEEDEETEEFDGDDEYFEIDDSYFDDIKERLEKLEQKIDETKELVKEKEAEEPIIEEPKQVIDESKYEEIMNRLDRIEQLIGEQRVVYQQVQVVEPKEEKVEEPEPIATETVIEEPTVVEEPEPIVQVVEATEELEDDDEKAEIIRLSFAEKLLKLDDKVQGFYNTICNYFVAYRNVNRRVSNAGVSFRWGRELVAKLTIRGKTMKLHLALNINDYDESLYFQKDYSDVKAYQEVPFTVKVKSERATKRALELIGALALEKGIEEKTRYNEIDALAEIKAKI